MLFKREVLQDKFGVVINKSIGKFSKDDFQSFGIKSNYYVVMNKKMLIFLFLYIINTFKP